MPDAPASPPWEQQTGESPQAYAAFSEYLAMGLNRSARAVARKLDRRWSLISRWSARWEWVDRARSFDNDRDRKDRREAEQVRLEGIRRQVGEEIEHERQRRAQWEKEDLDRRAKLSEQARQRARFRPRRNGRWVKVEQQASADKDELQGWPTIPTWDRPGPTVGQKWARSGPEMGQ